MASQRSLLAYFNRTVSNCTPEQIAKGIVSDIINEVISQANKPHDGNFVKRKTLDGWEKSFPWLETVDHENESGTFRLTCALCREFKMNTVWAKDGTPNIQRSSIERHSDSEMHIEALRLSLG